MRLYLASPILKIALRYRELHPETKPNILLSFGSINSGADDLLNKYRALFNSIIFDLGTWTLENSKKKNYLNITCDGYEEYLKLLGQHYDFYFNFDEVFFEKNFFEVNRNHQLRLEKAGLKPVYVLHSITGPEVEYCIDQGYKFLAIGSGSLQKKEETAWIVHKLYDQGIKAHLFGMMRYDFLESIPAFSCDSSSWTKSASFDDAIMYWNPKKPGVNKTDKIYLETKIKLNPGKRFFYSTYRFKKDIDAYLWNNLNLTYRDLLGYNGLFNRQLVNMHYFMEIEKRITERHRELGYPY